MTIDDDDDDDDDVKKVEHLCIVALCFS